MGKYQPYVNAGVSPKTVKPTPAKKPTVAPKGTNVGAGTKPVPAPGKPSKPSSGDAGFFGGLGPNGYINSLYAPQEAALATQQANRSAALNAMVSQFLNSIKDVGSSLAPYTNSASQQTSDANNAAASLAAANPNAVTQNDLAAINAPQAQRSQVAGQNSTAFGGNAALLQYTGGVIPSDQFRDDASARASYLATLPSLGEQLGIRGLSSINNLASKENTDLATSKAGDLLKARNDLATYVQGNQKLKAAAQKTAFDQAATSARIGQGQQRITQGQERLNLSGQIAAFNMKYKGLSLDLQAKKFAQSTLNQNRSYGVALQRLGITKKSLQLRALNQEYKLKSGGFTPVQLNRFKSDSAFVIDQAKGAKATPNYLTVMDEMLKRHVPVSIATKAIRAWNPTLKGEPLLNNGTASFDFGDSLGGLSGQSPFGSKARLQGPQLSQLATQALQIAAPEFATPQNVQALVGRIMQESGGNAGAINLWDSNAKAGTPSKGILQTIDSTFNAHKLPGHNDIWNPLDNAIAAIRYMVSRYGRIVGPSNTGY